MTSKKQERERTFHQYCQLCTCAGVADWYYARRFVGKLFWAILITAGLCLTALQTYCTFNDFLHQSPYQTTLSMETTDNGAKFPYLTVCNFNRAKQSIINKTNLDPKVLIYAFSLFPITYDVPLTYIKDNRQREEYMASLEKAWTDYRDNGGISNVFDILEKYAHDFDETIIMFSVKGQPSILNKTKVYTPYGMCWKINFSAHQRVPGPMYGISIKLNPMLNEYMQGVVFSNFLQQGFVVSLDYGNDPFFSNPIFLRPGTAVNIAIQTVRNTVKDGMFLFRRRKCKTNTTLEILNVDYSQQSCVFDCYSKYCLELNNCTLLLKTRSHHRLCNISLSQSFYTSDGSFSNNVNEMTLKCIESCEHPCYDFNTVQSTTTTAVFGIENFRHEIVPIISQLLKDGSYESAVQAATNVVALKIYFHSTEVVVSETGETTPIMAFIGNVGGQLGLWLGISLFSIIQFFYYIILGCCRIKDHVGTNKENFVKPMHFENLAYF